MHDSLASRDARDWVDRFEPDQTARSRRGPNGARRRNREPVPPPTYHDFTVRASATSVPRMDLALVAPRARPAHSDHIATMLPSQKSTHTPNRPARSAVALQLFNKSARELRKKLGRGRARCGFSTLRFDFVLKINKPSLARVDSRLSIETSLISLIPTRYKGNL
jgi:hypothetical protein